jgi:hypothetical protein
MRFYEWLVCDLRWRLLCIVSEEWIINKPSLARHELGEFYDYSLQSFGCRRR